jgi:hypothetical protein
MRGAAIIASTLGMYIDNALTKGNKMNDKVIRRDPNHPGMWAYRGVTLHVVRDGRFVSWRAQVGDKIVSGPSRKDLVLGIESAMKTKQDAAA